MQENDVARAGKLAAPDEIEHTDNPYPGLAYRRHSQTDDRDKPKSGPGLDVRLLDMRGVAQHLEQDCPRRLEPPRHRRKLVAGIYPAPRIAAWRLGRPGF